MKIYSIVMHDHTGDSWVKCFSTEEARKKYLDKDVQNVIDILKEDGYLAQYGEGEGLAGVYVDGTDIYYDWEMFESELIE